METPEFIKDLLRSSDEENRVLGKKLLAERDRELKLRSNLRLEVIRDIQTRYPLFHVGGSAGLFLHGCKLQRWYKNESDIDMVSPHYQFISEKVHEEDCLPSGCDFHETFVYPFKGTQYKVDYRIDPYQRFEKIEFEGFTYNVSKLQTIMEAKIRYSKRNKKHRDDVYEICGKKPKVEPVVYVNTDPSGALPW